MARPGMLEDIGKGFQEDALQVERLGRGHLHGSQLHGQVPAKLDAGGVEPRLDPIAQVSQCRVHAHVLGLHGVGRHPQFVQGALNGLLHFAPVGRAAVDHAQQSHQLRAHAVVQFADDALPLFRHDPVPVVGGVGVGHADQLAFRLFEAGRQFCGRTDFHGRRTALLDLDQLQPVGGCGRPSRAQNSARPGAAVVQTAAQGLGQARASPCRPLRLDRFTKAWLGIVDQPRALDHGEMRPGPQGARTLLRGAEDPMQGQAVQPMGQQLFVPLAFLLGEHRQCLAAIEADRREAAGVGVQPKPGQPAVEVIAVVDHRPEFGRIEIGQRDQRAAGCTEHGRAERIEPAGDQAADRIPETRQKANGTGVMHHRHAAHHHAVHPTGRRGRYALAGPRQGRELEIDRRAGARIAIQGHHL